MPPHPLLCHPATPSPHVSGIEVIASFRQDRTLVLAYLLSGRLQGLRIPEATTAVRSDDLWRHTCFEAFVQGDDAPAYREFNFSPAGSWQTYAFTAYRQGGLQEPAVAPGLTRREAAGQFRLECSIPGAALPTGKSLRLGLSAVIESADGSLSYWSLRHPPGKPDFHHPDTFILELP